MDMSFKVDKDTLWEDTGTVTIHNFPPSKNTFAYIKRQYREYKKGVFGFKLVDGEPVYINDLNSADMSIAIILAYASNYLSVNMPREKFLKPIKSK